MHLAAADYAQIEESAFTLHLANSLLGKRRHELGIVWGQPVHSHE